MLNREIKLALFFIVFYLLVEASFGQNETTKYTLNNLTIEILRNTRTAAEFWNSNNLNEVNTDDNKIFLFRTKRHRRRHRRKKTKQKIEEEDYHVKYHTKFAFQNIDEQGLKVKYNKSEHVYYGEPGADIPPPENISPQPQENELQQQIVEHGGHWDYHEYPEIHASHSEESCEDHEAEHHTYTKPQETELQEELHHYQHETSHHQSQEITAHHPEEISIHHSEEILHHHLEEISPHHPEEISPHHPEEISHHHPEEISAHHPEEISPHHPEEISAHHPEEVSPHHPEEILHHHSEEISPYQIYEVPPHHSQEMPDHHSHEMSHHSYDITGSHRQYEVPAIRIPFYPEKSPTHRRRHRHRHKHGKDHNHNKRPGSIIYKFERAHQTV